MKNDVFITGTSCYFPNKPVSNEDMEDFLGLITGKHSRVKPVILKQNGIKQRYYALTKEQKITHTNAEMAVNSILQLSKNSDISNSEIELLSCATSSPDQMLPSHASMVHGLLKNKPLEIFSASGICLSCLQAFKTAFWGVLSGEKRNAICSTSELTSATLLSKNYDIEYEKCADLGVQPYMALEKDFLRFMLSDGASAVLLQDNPGNGKALHVEWVEMTSYANELPTCMYMGAERKENGELKSWKSFNNLERTEQSLFVVKQDVKLLGAHAVPYWAKHIKYCLEKHNVAPESISYVLPHVSSMFFYDKIINELKGIGIGIDESKWFTNLSRVGNIASAAIFAILDEFWKTHELKSGEKILLLVPESGRFSYGTVLLSVV
ncbi:MULTISPECIES: StlD/DarB family beta-ketosynthase [Bacteroidales]|uniref:StlD/DarB family beta-ketosynthase n=1 Tax=Bacteroidales TaxID=171549 RepID=UPI00232EF26E|nr:StlD/DarB family beta-ketosynthase [Bacteroides ovatus]MDC1547413.1 StlD/DarB family beta-ketosynthase [Phocaeicola vulgatus]MDC1551159.1 StlD/DarB family beta-ketosynthase [Phocaeicola vulgatus]MDC1555841.1 StlD/DarB family beta-ketosynthase [Phocaeicola vulgatus]MDC1559541.1 StlD/DarB family beta-ketosynthase [Phocaeicola vulgatus]MDC2800856.1 StlD/DarB family beta-ketosynthase [Bacteroides ovatus]